MGAETESLRAAGAKRWLAGELNLALVLMSLCLNALGPEGASSRAKHGLARLFAPSPLRMLA